ncbi:hypothetical protein HMPREF1337_02127 [Enterococcus faecalis ERV65]|uniref:Uncharacterized protein n=1 Tax=Enterococcus faecalis ERV63 TaxID=1134793 RepID=A0AAV3GL05_ENTFL|nr:hypothetical protein HMPREF1330_02847 [Enterococcus faecalis ERV129]EJU94609.1 hypothetical protein HMPREF1331_02911 [Enterococcus faecalis ERV25]EJU98196.1 hypothetical protein HMPREF1332_01592 [Enterococcus faecalis ERV31]EJV15307.1 hypothetical protein HMPREF1336_02235 [Enterococcus faecalis ERV63]EJV16548.1 hypothetical protein HMPREF1337_02127 [Enterococcus faecalis ERV65]EJV23295.1 hypothetical protein HMPREF1339_02833 [Enterococcus faecalis ERV72]
MQIISFSSMYASFVQEFPECVSEAMALIIQDSPASVILNI